MEAFARIARPSLVSRSRIIVTRAASHQPRRLASTAPSRRRGRATGTLLRWGLAGAAVYYYNTASAFAEEPAYAHATPETHRDAETYATVDTIAAQRRTQARASLTDETPYEPVSATDGSPQELEEEAAQQGAFNEETGEINWDCPCLGGMADGPCGEQFKAAFSCFVFSKEEPKGMDCVEHFKTMQNCFREHPDVYGSELEPDETDIPADETETGVGHAVEVAKEHVDYQVNSIADNIASDASRVAQEASSVTAQDTEQQNSIKQSAAKKAAPTSTTKSPSLPADRQGDEGGDLVPKAWHDSRSESAPK